MKATAFDLQRTYRDEWQLIATLTTDSVQEAMRLVSNWDPQNIFLLSKCYGGEQGVALSPSIMRKNGFKGKLCGQCLCWFYYYYYLVLHVNRK